MQRTSGLVIAAAVVIIFGGVQWAGAALLAVPRLPKRTLRTSSWGVRLFRPHFHLVLPTL